jgi:hypothetical protein
MSSKSRPYAVASSVDPATSTTFSSRVNASSVQFSDPVHTDEPSRITYLWCMRSGTPGISFTGTPADASSSVFVRGGGGTGIG